jgi:hypothetical protein
MHAQRPAKLYYGIICPDTDLRAGGVSELWLYDSIGNASWEVARECPDIAASLAAARTGIRRTAMCRTVARTAALQRQQALPQRKS